MVNGLEDARKNAEAEQKKCADNKDKLEQENDRLSKENIKLRKDTLEMGDYQRKMQRNYAILHETYDKLIKNQDRLQSSTNEELSKREKELIASEKNINQLRTDLEQREQKVSTLNQQLEEKEKVANALKQKIAEVLFSFKDKNFNVQIKNSKVYVSLPNQILFRSGSIEVESKGKEAIAQLAMVIKQQKDITIMIEGHTDDSPYLNSKGMIKDNWDLSVLRASSIAKLMVSNGINPINLVPAGRAEFDPISAGMATEDKQANRRTELILIPNLDTLFKLYDESK
jgi:chemotaxis protein MotB